MVVDGCQTSMPTSLSYLKDSSTYSVISCVDLVWLQSVCCGGEGGFVSAGCWFACSDGEMRVAGSFGGAGVGWTEWSGGEGVPDDGGDIVLKLLRPV